MAQQAEHVQQGRSTAKTNSAAFSASTFTDQSVPERGGEDNIEKPDEGEKPHGFSKKVAEQKRGKRKLGASAGVVLRYLCALQRKYGKVINGRRWNRINLDHISKQYSYLGRSTVDEIIAKLVEFGACEVENMNHYFTRRPYDRTNCFHVPEAWMNVAEEEIRYFLPSVAQEVGIPAAAIYFNFMHWIGEWNEDGQQACVRLIPSVLKTLQPFSPATIKRALADLREHKFIASLDGNPLWYVVGARKAGSLKADEGGSNPDEGGSNPDEGGSNPDEGGSKVERLFGREFKTSACGWSFELFKRWWNEE